MSGSSDSKPKADDQLTTDEKSDAENQQANENRAEAIEEALDGEDGESDDQESAQDS